MIRPTAVVVAATVLSVLASGCPPTAEDGAGEGEGEGEGEPAGVAVTIPFAGLVDGAPFACTGAFTLGADDVAATFLDARFYVHDVVLVAGSEFRPVTLDDDTFQRGGVALMDFENGDTTSCDTGSPETHTALTGRVSSVDGVTGIAFVLGVPEAQNHLDVAGEGTEAPLNIPSMYWNWTGGYKFLKVDVAADESGRTSFFHLGSTVCSGEPGAITCLRPNRVAVELTTGFVLDKGVAVDFARLFDGITLAAAPEASDPVKGCMSAPTDPECTTPFSQVLGLAHGEADMVGPQTLFTAAE